MYITNDSLRIAITCGPFKWWKLVSQGDNMPCSMCVAPMILLAPTEAGPAAGEGVGVIMLTGEGMASASGVWLKSSRQMGEFPL